MTRAADIPESVLRAARAAAAQAQSNETVRAAILSGKFDDWPNVLGAAIAILKDTP